MPTRASSKDSFANAYSALCSPSPKNVKYALGTPHTNITVEREVQHTRVMSKPVFDLLNLWYVPSASSTEARVRHTPLNLYIQLRRAKLHAFTVRFWSLQPASMIHRSNPQNQTDSICVSHVDPLRKAYPELASMLADPPKLTGMRVRFLVAVMTSDGGGTSQSACADRRQCRSVPQHEQKGFPDSRRDYYDGISKCHCGRGHRKGCEDDKRGGTLKFLKLLSPYMYHDRTLSAVFRSLVIPRSFKGSLIRTYKYRADVLYSDFSSGLC